MISTLAAIACSATLLLTHTGKLRQPTTVDEQIMMDNKCPVLYPKAPCLKAIVHNAEINHYHVVCGEPEKSI